MVKGTGWTETGWSGVGRPQAGSSAEVGEQRVDCSLGRERSQDGVQAGAQGKHRREFTVGGTQPSPKLKY